MKTKTKMKRYADIYNTNGIAAIFAANYGGDFALFFAGNTAADVDKFILHRYANKWLSSNITAENAAAVIVGVIAVYLQAWQKIYAALTAQYDAAQSANETKTKIGTIERDNTDANTTVNSEKAFNDSDFVGDTQNAVNGTFNGVETYNLTETRTEINGNAAAQISREIDLRKRNNLQLQIIDAIIYEITLNIY